MNNDIAIESIEITYPDSLIPWILDINYFKEVYPEIYLNIQDNIQKMDQYDIEDAFPETVSFDFSLFSTQYDSIKILLSDGTSQSIKNTDLIQGNQHECDGYRIYYENQYLYCILSICAGQAGSLGIWDIQKKEWLFKSPDEDFCIESVVYLDKKNVFIAYGEWYSYIGGGAYYYIIKTDGSYQEIVELHHCEDFDWGSISNERMRSMWNKNNYFLGYDETQCIFFTIKDNIREAFYLPSTQ